MAVEFIAEAGVAHYGKLEVARKLADTALDVGAKVVKFQTFTPDKVLRSTDPAYDELAALALSRADFVQLAKHCEDIGIEFLTTPGDLGSLKFAVEELGVKRLKIGSDDLTNTPLLRMAAFSKLPVILSTGMAEEGEIWDALLELEAQGSKVTLLHCVSLYPCPAALANVSVIPIMKHRFCVPVGYSDHTCRNFVCEAAAALGASVIEAHLMLREFIAPVDAAVSYTPNHFRLLIQKVQQTESCLGSGKKEPCQAELDIRNKLRKSPTDWLRGVP